MIIFVSL